MYQLRIDLAEKVAKVTRRGILCSIFAKGHVRCGSKMIILGLNEALAD